MRYVGLESDGKRAKRRAAVAVAYLLQIDGYIHAMIVAFQRNRHS